MVDNRRSTDFMDELNKAASANPISAALIGAGIAWLLLGASRKTILTGVAGGLASSVKGAGDALYQGASAAGSGVASGAGVLTNTARDAAGGVANAVMDRSTAVVETVRESASRASAQLAEQAGELYRTASEKTSRGVNSATAGAPSFNDAATGGASAFDAFQTTLKEQPLLLGVIGLAIGGALATAAPVSSKERALGNNAVDAIKQKGAELLEQADRAGSQALQRAEAAGLDPDTLTGRVREAVDKVAKVADQAVSNAGGTLKH